MEIITYWRDFIGVTKDSKKRKWGTSVTKHQNHRRKQGQNKNRVWSQGYPGINEIWIVGAK
jgi:hypothetical protein